MAGAHIVAHAFERGGDVFFLGLFERGAERGVQRQAGGEQAGELAREPGQVGVGQARAQGGAQAFGARGGRGRQGQQAAAAQLVAGAALAVGVDRAVHDFAERVSRFVTKGWHGGRWFGPRADRRKGP